jgi:hypothetical protein
VTSFWHPTRLAQPITRRRPGGVGSIPAELTLQLRDLCLESHDDRPQLHDDRCLGGHGRLQIQLRRRDRGLRQVERHARLPIRRRSTSNTTTASGSTQRSMLWVSVRTGPAGAPSTGSRLPASWSSHDLDSGTRSRQRWASAAGSALGRTFLLATNALRARTRGR